MNFLYIVFYCDFLRAAAYLDSYNVIYAIYFVFCNILASVAGYSTANVVFLKLFVFATHL